MERRTMPIATVSHRLSAQDFDLVRAIHMFDGLESSRSRVPGHREEVVIALAAPRKLASVLLDYTFFVNNNPLYVRVEGWLNGQWRELVPKTKSKAFAGNKQEFAIVAEGAVSQLRVTTYPDGGINRIRLQARD